MYIYLSADIFALACNIGSKTSPQELTTRGIDNIQTRKGCNRRHGDLDKINCLACLCTLAILPIPSGNKHHGMDWGMEKKVLMNCCHSFMIILATSSYNKYVASWQDKWCIGGFHRQLAVIGHKRNVCWPTSHNAPHPSPPNELPHQAYWCITAMGIYNDSHTHSITHHSALFNIMSKAFMNSTSKILLSSWQW